MLLVLTNSERVHDVKIFILISTSMIILLLAGCGNNNDHTGGSGLIEADETVVSAETSGRVLERLFEEGSVVSEGDTLVIIDQSRLELQLESAVAGQNVVEAGLSIADLKVSQTKSTEEFAQKELDRVARLLRSGTANQKQYDQVEFEKDQSLIARETAEAEIARLQAELMRTNTEIAHLQRLLDDCFPLAPLSGVVTEKYVQTGELLTPGKPIARITQLDSVWVKVYFPAGSFANIELGTHAAVSTESGGGEYNGTVVWTSPEAEFTPKNVQTEESRADLVYAIKVRIPNTDNSLKVGMPVFVTVGDQ